MGGQILAAAADGNAGAGVGREMEDEEERAEVLKRLDRLDVRERTIVSLRFGFEGEAQTLQQIGRRLGVTRECVRKIELRAISKLRGA